MVVLVYRSVVDEVQVLLGRGGIISHLDLTDIYGFFFCLREKSMVEASSVFLIFFFRKVLLVFQGICKNYL